MCSLCDSDFPYEKGHITRTCLALVGMGREENTLGNAERTSYFVYLFILRGRYSPESEYIFDEYIHRLPHPPSPRRYV